MWRESRFVPIEECGDPLVPIPLEMFAVVTPHPYAAAGAPYGQHSPYYLRAQVLHRLLEAQRKVATASGLRLLIFDAYRPVAVQEYMVRRTLAELAAERGHHVDHLSADQRRDLLETVNKFWAVPTHDPTTPPPHSTGAAIDLTLAHPGGDAIDMGGDIDELSARSWPDHYDRDDSAEGRAFRGNRAVLHDAMTGAGFEQHPNEWWHFSFGDQLWAWLVEQSGGPGQTARFGAAPD